LISIALVDPQSRKIEIVIPRWRGQDAAAAKKGGTVVSAQATRNRRSLIVSAFASRHQLLMVRTHRHSDGMPASGRKLVSRL